MKGKGEDFIIQCDARGRIQHPKKLRTHKFFRLDIRAGSYSLVPLSFIEKRTETVWLVAEVGDFLASTIFPKLKAFADSHSVEGLRAIFLYGSRARGDALSRSDFDFGLLFQKYPSATQRHQIADRFENLLAEDFR